MSDNPKPPRGRAVPTSRFGRLARFGGMASGIAGGMLAEGARTLARGDRPRMDRLLLTPANARRVTDQLANLRGAAMKMGQLMSMDAGDLLPRELTDILSRLRADAHHMPGPQLNAVLAAGWGRDWRGRFQHFDAFPIAAASIGQVHRARLPDGRVLAIKVQYPGVRTSIDSDVDNVASLLRLSNLVPATLDLAPLLAEAKRQLHQEADYAREAAYLGRYRALLVDRAEFVVPDVEPSLTTPDILAMSFEQGVAIDRLVDAPQEVRDRAMALLIELVLRELFEFGLMQTDPNFANYLWDAGTERLVLLDFGATRKIPAELAEGYRRLARAGLDGDPAKIWDIALELGFVAPNIPEAQRDRILAMAEMAVVPLRAGGPFDFGNNDIALRLRDDGLALAADRALWHIPPAETLFIQRKLGGMYLLASRLRARVDVAGLLARFL